MSTQPTTPACSKSAALLEILAAAPAQPPDPNASARMLNVACKVINRLLRENVIEGSTRASIAVADSTHLHPPDADADVRRIGYGLVLEEPRNYQEFNFTEAQLNTMADVRDIIRSTMSKQFKGDKKPETQKIYESLRALG